jgi:ribosomal protein L40E
MCKSICRNCGVVGVPKTHTRGNMATEILLWMCFIVPGVLYSIWRLTTRAEVCRSCWSGNIVPVHSPLGRKVYEYTYGKKLQG